MRTYYILFISCILSTSVFASTNVSKEFESGNLFFQKGDYKQAAKVYESILQEGVESAELYFNLGNTYFKSGETALAILNYERAKKLSPSDEDIEFNLKLANLKTTDKIEALPEVFYKKWWNSLSMMLSTDEWAKASIWILFLSVAFLILYTVSTSVVMKKLFFFTGLVFIFSGIGFYFLANNSMHLNFMNREAIVFSPSTYVKSSPDEKSTDLFILHEGTKMKVLDEVGAWKKIRIDNGNLGWLKAEEIKEI